MIVGISRINGYLTITLEKTRSSQRYPRSRKRVSEKPDFA